MRDLLIVTLLALATLKVVDFITELVPGLRGAKTLLTFLVSVGGVVGLNYSIFTHLDIGVRSTNFGVWGTGFMVAGTTVFVTSVIAYLTRGTKTDTSTSTHLSKAA